MASAANGILWANTIIVGRKQEPLYCPPPKLSLTSEKVLDMLRKDVKELPAIGESPWGLVMLLSLHEAFPCH